METVLTSLAQSGLLPWAALLTVVLLGSVVMLLGGARRTRSASVRLRDLDALREGRAPSERYRASTMMRVVDDPDMNRPALLSDALAGFSNLIGHLPLFGAKDREKLRSELAKAGIRRDDALGLYITAKIVSTIGGLLLAAAVMTGLNLFSDKVLLRIALLLVGLIMGSFLPDYVLKRMIAYRQVDILRNIPDALDLMVICTEAGLSLDPTVERVARELRLSAPELSRELAVMSHEMRILPKRDMALSNFAERNDYREVKSLVSTLIQTMKYGTSLAHSLRILANESRNARMLAIEERAARLPAMMTIPLICFMLPAVFLVIGGPAIAQVMKLLHH